MLQVLLLSVSLVCFNFGCRKRGNIGFDEHNISQLKDDRTPFTDVKMSAVVKHLEPGGNWQVDISLSRPVDMLVFRGAGGSGSPYNPKKTWTIAEAGFNIDDSSGNGAVSRNDRSKFAKVSFKIKCEADISISEDMIYLFSDGSIGLNLMYLTPYIAELDIAAQKWQIGRLTPIFNIKPMAGEVVSNGVQTSQESIRVQPDKRSLGEFIYFGKSQSQKIESFYFLAEGGVPTPLSEIVKRAASATIKKMTEELGALPFTPFVVVRYPYGVNTSEGAGGTASWGSFIVNVGGDGVDIAAENRNIVLNAVVHETSHFWAAVTYQMIWDSTLKSRLIDAIPESTYDTWIWEGGAEALALETQKSTSLIDDSTYDSNRKMLLDMCIEVLKDKRVIDAEKYQAEMVWAPYRCGQWFQHAIVDLIRKKKPNYTIYDLWRAVIKAAGTAKEIDNTVFFKALRAESPDLTDESEKKLRMFFVTPGTELKTLVDTF